MNKYFSKKDGPFLLLSFFIPLICFLLTGSKSLMFDDSAEFALVIKLGSIAHPPGTPSYILIGFLWTKFTSLFGVNIIYSLTTFASLCISFSSLLLYITLNIISKSLPIEQGIKSRLICCLSAIGFATASTTWAWANTVEVYSFQVLAMSLTLYGLINYHFSKKNSLLYISAAGIALGLGNHHLTMVLFLPFIPFFFMDNVFVNSVKSSIKIKNKNDKKKFSGRYFDVLKLKAFWKLSTYVLLLTTIFYSWMFIRAQQEYPFMFGRPETLSEFIYHISGATYVENITSGSDQLTGFRFLYFIKLTALQLLIFLPFLVIGFIVMIKNKLFPLLWMILLYFLLIFYYQLNNNQWASTDAYMLLPFLLLFIAAFYGAIYTMDKFKLQYILPILIIFHLLYNLPRNNRRTYPVSDSLMKLLDKSAPKNSIIIIADWTLIIQYYYYRIVENFRPDLIVLNNDIKFNHYRLLPIMYPDFYNQIKTEYDSFVDELMKEHPHQAIGTGCDLTTIPLATKFKTLVNKIEDEAKAKKVYFLTDPKAHYFYGSNNLYASSRFVSGCFSSSIEGDSSANKNFLDLNFEFLKSPMLLSDPAAIDKLTDIQTMINNYMDYYRSTNNVGGLDEAQNAQYKIHKIQRQMKKNMPFAFEIN